MIWLDGCTGPCRSLGDSKYNDSTFHIPVEQTQIHWSWSLLACYFRENYLMMVTYTRYVKTGSDLLLAQQYFPVTCVSFGAKSRSGLWQVVCQIMCGWKNIQLLTDQHELHQSHQIHCCVVKNYLSWKFSELIFCTLQVWCDITVSEIATEGTWQWSSCMYIWCRRSFLLIVIWMLTLMLCYTRGTRVSKTSISPLSTLKILCPSDADFVEQNTVWLIISVEAVNLAFHNRSSCNWKTVLKALPCFSWWLFSETVNFVAWDCNQYSPTAMDSLVVLERALLVFTNYQKVSRHPC